LLKVRLYTGSFKFKIFSDLLGEFGFSQSLKTAASAAVFLFW